MLSAPAAAVSTLLLAASTASAQWNPQSGQWGKEDPTDLRLVTWNIEDAIVSSSTGKAGGFNNWEASARVVAALQPDILVLQEMGDRSGNGSGSGVDSVADLETAIDLWVNGGNDPFTSINTVNAYIRAYAPAGYDLPFVYVSPVTDGFNRNVIMSRYPFADINDDGQSTYSDFFVQADQWVPATAFSGIRGTTTAEIDLPNDVYAGDFVVITNHLKAGGSSSDRADRVQAAQIISYTIEYYYNGNGTGISDPNNRVIIPGNSNVLDDNTPVVLAGDLNEDELTNGRKGPVEWITNAQSTSGTSDGTDRDGTNSTADTATDPINGSRNTIGGGKLDYVIWQDSITAPRREFVFNSSGKSATQLPPELASFTVPSLASNIAADHFPVVVDFILPAAPTSCTPDLAAPFGSLDFFDVLEYLNLFDSNDPAADLAAPIGMLDFFDVLAYLSAFDAGC
ncbi:MAG: GC-type dockerin domain-anchored protein [Planctomycetota bacterium]